MHFLQIDHLYINEFVTFITQSNLTVESASTYIAVTLGVVDQAPWPRFFRCGVYPHLGAAVLEGEHETHGIRCGRQVLVLALLVRQPNAMVVADHLRRTELTRGQHAPTMTRQVIDDLKTVPCLVVAAVPDLVHLTAHSIHHTSHAH